MGNQSISIIEKIATWCGSFTGVLTILIVAITANRMILTAIREKRGKDSMFYRNTKTISFMLYAVFFVNVIGAICGGVKSGAISIGTWIAEMPWAIGMILAIIYIVAFFVSMGCGRHLIVWISTVIVIFGTQLLTQNALQEITDKTIGVAVVTIALSLFASWGIAETNYDNTKDDESEKSHKGFILTALWIASLIAAYLAGEYSLIPKLIEYFQERAQKIAARAEAKKQAKAEKEAKGKENVAESKPVEAE